MMSGKKIYLIFCLLAVISFTSATGTFETEAEKFPLSLDVKNEKITQVLEKISKASGYRIILSGEGEDMPVSLQLKDMSLEEMLRRVLWNLNYTAVWNHSEKKILLAVYGVKGKPGGKPDSKVQAETGQERSLPDISSQPQIEPHEFWKNTVGDKPEQAENRSEEPEVSISGTDTPFVQGTDTVNP